MQYYIDPVSEKLFRSMKDVNRYLENEEPRRLILEPSHGSDKELEDEKASVSIMLKKGLFGFVLYYAHH